MLDHETDPHDGDSDHDGVSDADEVHNDTDAHDPHDPGSRTLHLPPGVSMGARDPLLLVLAACSGGSVKVNDATSTGDVAGDADTDVDADADVDADPVCFEDDVVPLFERSCGSGANACHAAIAYGADPGNGCFGWLSLEDRPLGSINPSSGGPTGCPDRDLYARLTELGGWSCYFFGTDGNGGTGETVRYVVPGDPDASYLWWKVDPAAERCNDESGAPTEAMPLAATLEEAELLLLRTWIAEGARKCGEITTGGEPSCEITSPAAGFAQDWREPFPFRATAVGSVTWTVGAVVLGGGTTLDVTLPVSGEATVTCTARDAQGNEATDSVTVTAISPWVEIWHPGDGETRDLSNGPFPFQTDASDLEDGSLTADVQWYDEGTWFGSGTGFDYVPPTAGYHTITAEVTDGDGNTGSASISIQMVP